MVTGAIRHEAHGCDQGLRSYVWMSLSSSRWSHFLHSCWRVRLCFLYFNSREAVADLATSGRGHCFYHRIRSGSRRNGRSASRRSFIVAGMVRPDESAFERRGCAHDAPLVDQCGVSESGKLPVFFSAPSSCWPSLVVLLLAMIPAKVLGFPSVSKSHILLCPGRSLWLLCSSALVAKGHCVSQGCASAGHSGCPGFDGGLCGSGAGIGSGHRSRW